MHVCCTSSHIQSVVFCLYLCIWVWVLYINWHNILSIHGSSSSLFANITVRIKHVIVDRLSFANNVYLSNIRELRNFGLNNSFPRAILIWKCFPYFCHEEKHLGPDCDKIWQNVQMRHMFSIQSWFCLMYLVARLLSLAIGNVMNKSIVSTFH